MVKSGFEDPIKIKVKEETKKSPWNFDAPCYDERTGFYVNAGSHYGVGHRQPVGHHGDPKQRVGVLPYGKKQGMEDDEVPRKNLKLQIDI